MADRPYSIAVSFKAEADLAAAAKTEQAIKSVANATKAAAGEGSAAAATLERDFQKLRESIEKSLQTFNGGIEEASGGFTWTADVPNLVAKAWAIGSQIGKALGSGIEHFLDGGTAGEAVQSWLKTFGVNVDAWASGVTAAQDRVNDSLANSRDAWEQWREKFESPPTGALAWLDQLQLKLAKAKESLSELNALEAARRRAAMDAIGQDEADELAALEADKSLPESARTVARAEIKDRAAGRRLDARTQGRIDEAQISRGTVTAAEQDVAQKKSAEAAAKERARVFSEIEAQAKSGLSGLDGEAFQNAFRLNFETLTKMRGITDMSPDQNERTAAEKTKAAREQSERELEAVRRRDQAVRERLAIEQQSDISTTARTRQRDFSSAQDKADAQRQAEIDAAQTDDVAAVSEQSPDLTGENMARAALDQGAQATGNAGMKLELEGLSAALRDGADGGEKQQLQQLIDRLTQTNTAAATQLADKLTQALAAINASQAAFNAKLQAADEQIQTLKSRQP